MRQLLITDEGHRFVIHDIREAIQVLELHVTKELSGKTVEVYPRDLWVYKVWRRGKQVVKNGYVSDITYDNNGYTAEEALIEAVRSMVNKSPNGIIMMPW